MRKPTQFTILGAGGFIGQHLSKFLQEQSLKQENISIHTPGRNETLTGSLGHVIYCIGLTADFRNKPWETIEAHICKLKQVLQDGNFDSLLYLSSTRVYGNNNDKQVDEDTRLLVDPQNSSDLYNLSKLMGEAACLAHSNPGVRVARLSNVFGQAMGDDNFLGSIINEIKNNHTLTLRSSLKSAKDYISIADVARLIYKICLNGQHRLYNIASGQKISNKIIIELLQSRYNYPVQVQDNAPDLEFPQISNKRIIDEFKFLPRDFKKEFTELLNAD